ncbi:MAG TPA: hypothetical protein DCL66_04675, partial [Gammaproteobacteria bacterium]|nr:hypothetical protein [Gammaproteobacteria bacterium]
AKPDHKPLPDDIRQLFPSEFELTEELGWVPKGWEAMPVSKIIDINPKVSLPKGVVAKFADMKALPTTGYSVTGVIEKAYSGGAKFQNGDVLLARITPCLENGKTGIVDFLNGNEAGFGSTEFITMRKKESIETSFIACLARDANFRKHCMQSMVGSSGRQRVQNACFDAYYMPIPGSEEILMLFSKMTSANFLKMSINRLESQSLTNLRDTLLPKLISGELRLPSEALADAEQQLYTFDKGASMTPTDMKHIRHQLNWSQEFLARQLGISLRSISRYEAGHTQIPSPVDIAVRSFLKGNRGQGYFGRK